MADSIFVEARTVELDRAATVFAALTDPARLQILALLGDTTRCVCDIRAQVPLAANLLSYHLRVLREAGLVEGRRRGRWIDYRLTDDAGARLADALGVAGFPTTFGRPAVEAAP